MKTVILARNFTADDADAAALLTAAGYEIIDCSNSNICSDTDEKTIAALIRDADAVIAGQEPYNESIFIRCPNLKVISRKGIGYDAVDLSACKKYNIALLRAAGSAEIFVAEHVMASLLYFSRRLDLQNKSMHSGKWERVMMQGLYGKTLGLVGFGAVGKEIALRAAPFGMKLLYYCRHPEAKWETDYPVAYADFNTLLSSSDYVSVNVPLTGSTKNLFNEKTLSKMKHGSVLINSSRGPVVNADALKALLDSGHLAGAGIDVYDREPCTDSPLIACENAILTPHTAAYTVTAASMINRTAAQNILDFFAGTLSDAARVV